MDWPATPKEVAGQMDALNFFPRESSIAVQILKCHCAERLVKPREMLLDFSHLQALGSASCQESLTIVREIGLRDLCQTVRQLIGKEPPEF